MRITFESLQSSHLPLLLKWLETPHVKAWWDRDIKWTPQLIEEKYGPYTAGYKYEEGSRKPMHAYIASVDKVEVGYIQYYNAYDFPRDEPIDGFPQSLAAFDIFIGESDYIGKGIGTKILHCFCKEYIFKEFENCLVDPEATNIGAIRAYKKAGFIEVKKAGDFILMLCSR